MNESIFLRATYGIQPDKFSKIKNKFIVNKRLEIILITGSKKTVNKYSTSSRLVNS